ncbi:UNKNOWN [Stylonychia lemnae]|uniref:Uncharacterized protein n=1 Tax=Stylonychia lemnae TaxID=5949 RepID=A0A078AUX5_STYLE|nr:UNKNOWN [Stylonychia lemnae]|eukprot:CDW86009.1 UNKNOWN [Stylonychia lemnae]
MKSHNNLSSKIDDQAGKLSVQTKAPLTHQVIQQKPRFQSAQNSKAKTHTFAKPDGRGSIRDISASKKLIPHSLQKPITINKENEKKLNIDKTNQSKQHASKVQPLMIDPSQIIGQLVSTNINHASAAHNFAVDEQNHHNCNSNQQQERNTVTPNQEQTPQQKYDQNGEIAKEDYQIQSDETLSWLLSSVDYGKFKKDKIKSILKHHNNSVTQNSIFENQNNNNLLETIDKIEKLFNFFSSNDDLELKSILKEEIDRLLRDAKYQSRQFSQELANSQKLNNETFDKQRIINIENHCTTAAQENPQLLSSSINNIEIKEFRTEFRSKKRKRREMYQLNEEDQEWLSFSSQDDEAGHHQHHRVMFSCTEKKVSVGQSKLGDIEDLNNIRRSIGGKIRILNKDEQ